MRKLGLVGVLLLCLPLISGRAGDDFKLEPGFTPLLNGKNLDGWKQKKKGGDSLAGKTEAFNGRFKVVDGVLVIDPKVKGDVVIETEKKYGKDVIIRFEFKPGNGCNNDLFFRGIKFDLAKGNVKNLKEGEWNELEIISTESKVEYNCNGELQRMNKTKMDSTPFGIRAEFGPVEIRRLRIKTGA